MSNIEHIPDDILEKYILDSYYSGDFSDEDINQLTIEKHLASCDQCAQKAHVLFNELKAISDWDVFNDNQVLLHLQVIKTLKAYEQTTKNQQIKQRLSRWIYDFKGLASGSFRVLMDVYTNGKRKTTRIINEGIEKLSMKNPMAFEYGMDLTPSRGGKTEKVINYNKLVSESEKNHLRINLDRKMKAIRIQYDSDETDQLPMALLLPTSTSGKPRIKEPVYNEERENWEIVFNDIEEGEYYFMFEPDHIG